jgi:hypothetical protein
MMAGLVVAVAAGSITVNVMETMMRVVMANITDHDVT